MRNATAHGRSPRPRRGSAAFCGALLVTVWHLSPSAGLTAAESSTVEFNRDVRPILSDRCFTCHGPDSTKRPTALRFDQEVSAYAHLAGGGYAIVPGEPAKSDLYLRVNSDDTARRMPPAYAGHAKLSSQEIDTIRRWIEGGAEWQKHWSFIPPRKAAIEPGKAAGVASSPIDYFVRRKLRKEALDLSPPAGRTTLLRRVSFDLTGLPPTPREVDEFLADSSPVAYEKAVDRLLDSPRFGEKMAYRWLDAARYADTNGYQNDQERYMWRWRDWVIAAFNRNVPFDQFTIEQLAGDLLPNATLSQKIATGFNRNHRGNGELGIVPAEYAAEYVVDRVETTSTVWLGLTLGCTRCHDHKYDPFTQKEFYRLYAYFNNVPDRGRYFKYGNTPPIVRAPTDEQQQELDELDGRIGALKRRLDGMAADINSAQRHWQSELASSDGGPDWSFSERMLLHYPFDGKNTPFKDGEPSFADSPTGRAAVFDGKRYVDGGDVANFSFFDKFTLAAWIRPDAPTGGLINRMQPAASARGDKGWGLYLRDGKLWMRLESTDIDDRVQVETVEPVALGEWQHVAVSYDGSRLAKGIHIYLNGEPQRLRVIIDHSNNDIQANKEPFRIGFGPQADDRYRGLIGDVRVFDRTLSNEEIGVVAVPEPVASIARLDVAARTPAQRAKLHWAFLAASAAPAVREAWTELRKLRLEREAAVDSFPTVMVMMESETPRETHLLKRGAYDAPGEIVTPGVPAVLPPLPAGAPANRLGLAGWIVSRDNPLTARVAVNRFWQMLFGTGLVKTVEDFGSQGEWPNYPDLLDWLAVEFMDSGWDVKGILKTIVMSETYRQSSAAAPGLIERDPENRLLARGPRLRLAAETLRDQALAVSGLLVEKQGGPSVRPYQPAGLWEELSNAGAYKHDQGDGLYRRSLYTFWKRTIGPPAMLTFDSAARETCIVRETRTNTPLQALNLMNDVTYAEAARMLAQRMMTEAGPEPAQRLAHGFRLATARKPAKDESEILLGSYRRYLDRFQTDPGDAGKYLSLGEHPRDQSLDPKQLAAYSAVASMILNLDETITKE